MGAILIILFLYWACTRNKNKNKKHHRHYSGKSDWERECDDGGKFFGW